VHSLFCLVLLAYVDVGKLHMYYEEHGRGPAVVMLHGGLSSFDHSFAKQIADFSRKHRVIGFDQQGHGHTPDLDRRLTYRQMAEDTVAAMQKLGIDRADFVGWSDGGIVAWIIAIDHPELVRRLVVSGAQANRSGYDDGVYRFIEQMQPDKFEPSFRASYVAESPDGAAHWPVIFAKVQTMWLEDKGWPLSMLSKIKTRTLIMGGDDDSVTPEHLLAERRAIADSALFIVPGASHGTFIGHANLVNPAVLEFLDAPDQKP
jgi:pimeloyl-ACP methyl ester carboxylesterase